VQTIEITDLELALSIPQVLAECLQFVTSSRAPTARITPAPRNYGVLEWEIVLTGAAAEVLYPKGYRYVQPRPIDKGRIIAND